MPAVPLGQGSHCRPPTDGRVPLLQALQTYPSLVPPQIPDRISFEAHVSELHRLQLRSTVLEVALAKNSEPSVHFKDGCVVHDSDWSAVSLYSPLGQSTHTVLAVLDPKLTRCRPAGQNVVSCLAHTVSVLTPAFQLPGEHCSQPCALVLDPRSVMM